MVNWNSTSIGEPMPVVATFVMGIARVERLGACLRLHMFGDPEGLFV
jgi:hypothetical protein